MGMPMVVYGAKEYSKEMRECWKMEKTEKLKMDEVMASHLMGSVRKERAAKRRFLTTFTKATTF